MVHTTPTKVLLTTTVRPLVVQLSGALAQGVRRIDQSLREEPPPQQMATCERALSALLREVGRRLMAWVVHHVEPEHPAEAPPRVHFAGRASRRRAKHRRAVATLCGPVDVWRRRYEPLERGVQAMHPLALQVGVDAGGAPPRVRRARRAVGRRSHATARPGNVGERPR